MLDNQLIALIIRTLIAGEQIAGIPNTPIKQAFQPTRQGIDTQPTAYLYKIGDRRYGFTRRNDCWNPNANQMVHTETQQYETTFQLSALATQNPRTPNQYTASDILNLCGSILQSAPAIQAFQSQGVGIERVTDVRNPYFLDDREQSEAAPSFDFVLTHKQIIRSGTPIIAATKIQIATV
jgi:hypothetical protein